MKVIAMITARMQSERFPGKVMAPLFGKPMVEWIITRMQETKGVDDVVLSTSYEDPDDGLAEHARRCGATVIRGSNDNLLSRHRQTIHMVHPDWVIDCSGDSPIYTPEVIERFIEAIPAAEVRGANCIGAKLPYNHSYGNPIGNMHARSWYEYFFDLYLRGEVIHREQYWIDQKEPFVDEEIVDCTDILPVEKTPVKISVDWPLELAVLDMICRYLGHFPKSLHEVYDAYRNINSVEGELHGTKKSS